MYPGISHLVGQGTGGPGPIDRLGGVRQKRRQKRKVPNTGGEKTGEISIQFEILLPSFFKAIQKKGRPSRKRGGVERLAPSVEFTPAEVKPKKKTRKTLSTSEGGKINIRKNYFEQRIPQPATEIRGKKNLQGRKKSVMNLKATLTGGKNRGVGEQGEKGFKTSSFWNGGNKRKVRTDPNSLPKR